MSELVSEKLEAEIVKEINDLYASDPSRACVTEAFLREKFPQEDPRRLISYLEARKLIEYRSSGLSSERTYKRLDGCVTYFEDKASRKAEKRSDRTHDWLIAIFSALAGALLSKPLWGMLESVWALFFRA